MPLLVHKAPVLACKVLRDGVLSASADGAVHLFDRGTLRRKASFRGHSAWVLCLACNEAKRLCVTGSHDTTLRVVTIPSMRQRAAMKGHTDSVTACDVSPGGALVLSGSKDTSVRLWLVPAATAAADKQEQRSSHGGEAGNGEHDDGGGGGDGGDGRQKTVAQRAALAEMALVRAAAAAAALHTDNDDGSDGDRSSASPVGAGDAAQTEAVCLWKHTAHTAGVVACRFHPDMSAVLTCDSVGAVHVIKAATGQLIRMALAREEVPRAFTSFALSPLGNSFAVGLSTGELAMYRQPDGVPSSEGGEEGTGAVVQRELHRGAPLVSVAHAAAGDDGGGSGGGGGGGGGGGKRGAAASAQRLLQHPRTGPAATTGRNAGEESGRSSEQGEQPAKRSKLQPATPTSNNSSTSSTANTSNSTNANANSSSNNSSSSSEPCRVDRVVTLFKSQGSLGIEFHPLTTYSEPGVVVGRLYARSQADGRFDIQEGNGAEERRGKRGAASQTAPGPLLAPLTHFLDSPSPFTPSPLPTLFYPLPVPPLCVHKAIKLSLSMGAT